MVAAVGSAEEVEMSAVGLAVVEMAAGLAALGGGGDGQMAAGVATARGNTKHSFFRAAKQAGINSAST